MTNSGTIQAGRSRQRGRWIAVLTALVGLVEGRDSQSAEPGRPLVPANSKIECPADGGPWKTIFTLPERPERHDYLEGLWVMESGELFAVGSVIVHCGVDQKCDVTNLPEHQGLAAVWGPTNTDVIAVGWRGLIMHCDGRSWTVERPMGPKSETRHSRLGNVGEFLPGVIVAGLPGGPDKGGNLVLKRIEGTWQPVTAEEWRVLYDAAFDLYNAPTPCRDRGVAYGGPRWEPGAKRAAVICNDDRRVFWKEDGRWQSHGSAKGVCSSRSEFPTDSIWFGSAWFLSCGKNAGASTLWIYEGSTWRRECVPDKRLWRFAATSEVLYAIGSRSIMRRETR